MGNSNEPEPENLKSQTTNKDLIVYKKSRGECSTCILETTLVNISRKCKHKAEYCANCISRYLNIQVTSKGSRQFQCPSPQCQIIWEPSDYYQMLDDRELKIVDKLNLMATLQKMEDFRWCKAKKGCGSGQLVANWKELQGID